MPTGVNKELRTTMRTIQEGEKTPPGSSRWPRGPSVTMAPKTMAGEVQHDEHQHKPTDHGEEDLDS
jgi:hypothetical protein